MISGPDRNSNIANQQALQKIHAPVVKPVPSTPDNEPTSAPPPAQRSSDASQVEAAKTKSFDFENGSVSFEKPLQKSVSAINSVGRIQGATNISQEAIGSTAEKLDIEFMSASFKDSLAGIETNAEKLHLALLNAGVSEQDLNNALHLAANMNGISRLS